MSASESAANSTAAAASVAGSASAAAAAPVRLVALGRRVTACIRLCVPRADMPIVFGAAIGELVDALSAHRIEPDGAAFAHHFFECAADAFDFEVGFFLPEVRPVLELLASVNCTLSPVCSD
jgi:hypothetical protein